jgi:dienelactone hydrolase
MANLTKLPSRKRFDSTVAAVNALAFTACVAIVSVIPCVAAVSWARLEQPWPDPSVVQSAGGIAVSWPSKSPFVPQDIGAGVEATATTAVGRLYLPSGPHPARSVPAVVLLHGPGGVLSTRELTYGPQLAKMGVAALVVDVFGARRDRGTEFIERLLNITETMMVADAYSGLRFLAGRPEIDPHRVVLIGFSYGAMATTFAVYAQIADALAPPRLRFAGHVAFYGPCIARFSDSRTTGAPLLMLIGGSDEIVDQTRCEEVAADLRAGGSRVQTIVYAGAVHQWDGGFERRPIGRNLSGCRLRIEQDGTVRDLRTGLIMTGPFRRKLILGLCTLFAGPYPIARDDRIRELSNADLGRFLSEIFSGAAHQRTVGER